MAGWSYSNVRMPSVLWHAMGELRSTADCGSFVTFPAKTKFVSEVPRCI